MTATAPRRSPARTATAGKPGVRALAAQETRDAILKAATRVFAKHGYSGGRVDAISKAARSYDRMIYYYYGSKEELFIAVLEDMYRRFNEAESTLELDSDNPVEALTAVITFMWTFYQRNPEFITLLNDENLHRGKHIAKSLRARDYSSPAIQILERVLEAGVRQKVFRAGLSGRDVYLMIAALNYFYLSNRHTLSAFLGEKLESPEALAHWQAFVVESVLRTVRP
ncbi:MULTISPECIES: TetR/AcrR family transcriptional regulator [Ramlibacter]|uniref:TetR family transcriptional regulator n=1 Tax=Ramlibacter pinisoli TaxID=2682844 RepID=A0A6N8IXG3_9BURK|nr:MULTISPECIES: TetR/AcrR family transcriptional regulator [Ramlibacter]MBA2961388.1 TetR family transcriptional regulator [Ramlibacter sp. CGMCC 1.13660]MVQ31332.1 TetR family transcriptional regulator [Ramlibacter pinisoli]